MIFPSVLATKTGQLKNDINALYYIYCGPLSSCTPTSEWEVGALSDVPFHFYLVLLVVALLKKKNPNTPPGQFACVNLLFRL